MKRTKIVATIGPATDSRQKVREILDEGVDVIRQNFSHVDQESHGEVYDRLRDVSEKVAIMADTKGPEIRLGEVEEGTLLEKGDTVDLVKESIVGDEDKLPINYSSLPEYVEEGDEVRIDDGRIELKVVGKSSESIKAEVVFGGEVRSRKSVNIPGEDIGLSAPTEKDRSDIKFAADKGYDFISLSFVKKAEDVEKARRILDKNGSDIRIISKIEHRKAVENFDEILEVSDGIMIARGDLGVEMPPEKLPMLQKDMIEKANRAGKPVITATQMLESMTESPTATRAEISDVGNAVFDGTDAVMLSGETAVGKYPVKVVRVMSQILSEVESSINDEVHHTVKNSPETVGDTICKNVWQASEDIESDFIVAHTVSGSTARNIAKYRPSNRIIAFTDRRETERQLQLTWGVEPFYHEFNEDVQKMIRNSAKALKDKGVAENDDTLILSAGLPIPVTGSTNMMQIRKVKDLLD